MYTSVRKLMEAGLLGKWVQVTEEEIQCIVDSIPGENLLRNSGSHNFPREAGGKDSSGNPLYTQGESFGQNLRHYLDRGYICVLLGP